MDRVEKLKKLNLPNSEIEEIKILEKGVMENGEPNEDMPQRCFVRIKSSLGHDSLIYSHIYLPENWNQQLIGIGGGGIGGRFGPEYYEVTCQGYVAAQTDMGTMRIYNKQLSKVTSDIWKDYGYRSTHIMTVLAKMIIEAYYGKGPEKSYFTGQSAGGIQGFSEAQRYPEDYDGILAGVPSNNAFYLNVYFWWLFKTLTRKDGTVVFLKEETEKIAACQIEFFKKRGMVEGNDDFLTYSYAGENTINEFLTEVKQKYPEFTDEKIEILRELYTGPVHKITKKRLFCGLPMGAEVHVGYMNDPSVRENPTNNWYDLFFADGRTIRDMEFDEEFDLFREAQSHDLCANNPDLTEFYARGGKLLIYSGNEDQSGPWADMMKYYNRVCEKMGGYEKVKDFCRFFLLPGKGHNIDGRGVNVAWGDENKKDLLDTLVDWCNGKSVPDYLVGAHETNDKEYKFIRKIYPYKGDKKEGTDFPYACDDEYLNAYQNK